MRVVWKYPISWSMWFSLLLPVGAEIIHYGFQGHGPTIWALVDPTAPLELRWFMLIGTGQGFEEEWRQIKACLGTAVDDDHLVGHLFEVEGPR